MNRPVIKGTKTHKASIAKAKDKSIVAQTRTKGDSTLIGAAELLGKSYGVKNIDYTLSKDTLKVPEGDDRVKFPGRKKKTDYGTYKEYVDDHNNLKKKMSEKDKKAYGEPLSEKDWTELNVGVGMKRPKEKRESYSDIRKRKKLEKRYLKAEQGEDEEDFSQIENEPSRKKKKDEPYISPSAGTEHGEELLRRNKEERNKALQEAAKKYGVKVEDLEAKEIGGKREFFPKQGAVGGKDETQWDDELGRFRKPEAKLLTKEEQKIAVQDMKPKFPEGMDPNLAKTGEIRLNYDTNTYEYTQQYYDRIAREKIQQKKEKTEKIQQKKQETIEPVVGKVSGEIKSIVSKGRQKRLDKKYQNAGPSVRANMIADGYIPPGSKTAALMRDDRIYANATKSGPVRKNMIKGGYIPPSER